MPLANIDDFFGPLPGGGSGILYSGPPLPYISSSTGEDGGTVRGLAKLLSGGITSHGSTSEMITKLKPHRGGIIVGHGSYGMFETGAGPWGYSDTKIVDFDNEDSWRDEFAKLWLPPKVAYDARGNAHNSYGNLWIYACCVAGGPNGKNLLQKLADLTNRFVIAFTGLIYVFSTPKGKPVKFRFERGSRLVQIWPTGATHKSKSLSNYSNLDDSPVPFLQPEEELFNINGSKRDEFLREVHPENIRSITIRLRRKEEYIEKEFEPLYADTVLQAVFYSKSFPKSGGVAGIITAVVTINYLDQSSLETNIYADRIAEKLSNGESCMTAPDFGDTIKQLFS